MTLLDQPTGRTASPDTQALRDRWPDAGPRQAQGQSFGASQEAEGGQNVGPSERATSVAAGAIVALLGLSRGSIPGLLMAGIGGAMMYRGASGHCPVYESLGIDTAHGDETQQGQGRGAQDDLATRGIQVSVAFTVNRPAEQLYSFWRDFENLPRIMTHLESVRTTGEGRSHWIAKAQGLFGKRLEWDAQVTRDEPNTAIAWHSLPGADVDNAGEVRFSKGLGDRGTVVRVSMSYLPPAGRLGHLLASLAGENPKRVIREDLRNFKRLMELGEILTIIGQPHGTCTGQGKEYTESQWRPLFT